MKNLFRPILKIELPEGTEMEHLKELCDYYEETSLAKEYHIMMLTSRNDYISVEIITASNINLHLSTQNHETSTDL